MDDAVVRMGGWVDDAVVGMGGWNAVVRMGK